MCEAWSPKVRSGSVIVRIRKSQVIQPFSTTGTGLVADSANRLKKIFVHGDNGFVRTPLLPERHPVRDFFVLDTLDMVPKSDMATMEHPIYSLSTKPERRRLSYTNGECKLELIPSSLGLPTVFDKDIMIYCISKLMRMKNEGEEFGPVVRLSTHDMLVETNRPTNNLGYERLVPALNRLRGVVINTTIATGSERTTRGFGLIDEFEYNRKGSMHSERLRYLEIKLSDWIFRAIASAEVLPISRDYDDHLASVVIAQLLFLEAESPEKDIYLYINSPGGSVSAGLAIYDTMQYVKPDVATICMGQAASMAAVLLAGGSKGKRFALPHARVLLHQPLLFGLGGQATDIDIHARDIIRLRQRLNEILQRHTGQAIERIFTDTERDFILEATDALGYGLIDKVIEHRE